MKEFNILSDVISLQSISAMVENNGIGARSVFEGIVRNINDGHEVKKLEYECYESLQIEKVSKISLEEKSDDE